MRLDLKLSRQREKSARFLYEFSSEMAGTVEKNVVAERLSLQVRRRWGGRRGVFAGERPLGVVARHSGERSRQGLNLNPPEAAEMAVANCVLNMDKRQGERRKFCLVPIICMSAAESGAGDGCF